AAGTLTLPSPGGLRDSRKLSTPCEDESGEGSGEALPALCHGLWTGWFIIAVPAAVARDDPREPGEGAFGMGVLLPGGAAFAGSHEDCDGALEGWVEDVAHGPRAAVAGVDELDDAHGGAQGQGGEVEQAFAVLDLGLLESQAIAFEGAEDLFDAPPQSIEANDLAGVRGALDRQGRHDAPAQRLGLAGGIRLDRFHEAELQHLGVGARRRSGPPDPDGSATQGDFGDAALVARPARRDRDLGDEERRLVGQSLEQACPAVERAIVARSDRQIDAGGAVREMAPDIPFP